MRGGGGEADRTATTLPELQYKSMDTYLASVVFWHKILLWDRH
jgi:hypothetical protein